MRYVNVGCYVEGTRPRTKKMLKDALTNGRAVSFDVTDMFTKESAFYADGAKEHSIPEGTTLTVVGPDPYRCRTWYANITLTKEGALRVT